MLPGRCAAHLILWSLLVTGAAPPAPAEMTAEEAAAQRARAALRRWQTVEQCCAETRSARSEPPPPRTCAPSRARNLLLRARRVVHRYRDPPKASRGGECGAPSGAPDATLRRLAALRAPSAARSIKADHQCWDGGGVGGVGRARQGGLPGSSVPTQTRTDKQNK
eukprot:1195082-Prorocentrum_minimum.AAC.17